LKRKSDLGGIVTNLDLAQISATDRYKIMQRERRQHFLSERIKRAEKAELHQGYDSPDIVFEGFQQDGVYSYNKNIDESRKAIEGRTSLPVKQYTIRTDGVLMKELAPAALEAVRAHIFCMRCEQRQPDADIQRRESWDRSAAMGLTILGERPKDNCAYCGGRLGIDGEQDNRTGYMTDEQKGLL
jgi:hypothetical protein